MKHIFLIAASLILNFPIAHAQSFTLKGFVKIPEGQSVLFGADTVSVGSKLTWYSNKGAFRADSINYFSLSSGTQWNSENIGQYSFASGVNTIASGVNSNARGHSLNGHSVTDIFHQLNKTYIVSANWFVRNI